MKSLQIVFGLTLAAGAASAQQYTISTIAGLHNVQGWYGLSMREKIAEGYNLCGMAFTS